MSGVLGISASASFSSSSSSTDSVWEKGHSAVYDAMVVDVRGDAQGKRSEECFKYHDMLFFYTRYFIKYAILRGL